MTLLKIGIVGYWQLKERYENLYNTLFGRNNIVCPWTYNRLMTNYSANSWGYIFVMRADNTSTNTSRALYLPSSSNANTRQIRMEFWGNDDNKNDQTIAAGIHTLSVTYDTNNINSQGTNVLKMYLDGTEIYTATKSTEPNTIVQEITVGAINYNITSLFNSNAIDLQYQYQEFFNNDVYSVRIYNEPLKADDIYKNYRIDKIRFNF